MFSMTEPTLPDPKLALRLFWMPTSSGEIHNYGKFGAEESIVIVRIGYCLPRRLRLTCGFNDEALPGVIAAPKACLHAFPL